MKSPRQKVLSACLSLGLLFTATAAWSATPEEPSAADLKNSKDRMFFKPLYPAAKPVAPATMVNKSKSQASVKAKTSSKITAGKSIVQPSTQQVSIQNSGNNLVLSAWLDRSGRPPTYKVGEKLQVNVKASQDCNITVFDFDEQGTLTQIYPNDYQPSGYVKAGESIAIGGPESKFDYEVAGRGGTERIFVYAYPANMNNPVTVAFQPQNNSPFRSTNYSLEQYRKLVNESKVFFSREVKVVPKSGVRPIAAAATSAPNKVELPFIISPQ